MMLKGCKRVIHVFLLSIFLLTSCSHVTKPENCIDLSHSFSYLDVGTEPGTLEQVMVRDGEFKKLEKWCHSNISALAGITGNYVWIKADFELPENLKGEDISFFVSYIHFAEKTFLNGEMIGESGIFPDKNGKGEQSSMYRTHFYRMNNKLLNRDGKNTIYIQIYSRGHAEANGYCYVGPTQVLTKLSTFNLFLSSRMYLLLFASPFITFLLFFVLFITRRKNKNWTNYFFAMENIFTIGMLGYFFAGEVPIYISWGIPHLWYTKIVLCCCTCLVIHFVSMFSIHYINGEIPKRVNIIQEILLIIIIIAIMVMPDLPTLMNFTWPIAALAFIKFVIGLYYPIRGLKNKEQHKKSVIFLLAFTPFYISIFAFIILNYIVDYSIIAYYPVLGHQLSNFVFIVILCKNMNRAMEENTYLNENLEREIQLQTVDLTFANERLEQEFKRSAKDLEMASIVQKKFLPPLENKFYGWEISVNYEPLSTVSGDLFDYYNDEDKLIGLSLFDASGHGIAASLVTMLSKNIIFRAFKESFNSGDSISSTLKRINNQIINAKGSVDNYLTGEILKIGEIDDVGKCNIELSSAGHPYPILFSTKENSIEELLTDPAEVQVGAIGIPDIEVSFPTIKFEMRKGDVLVVFTDGLLESANENHEQFGRERINEIVRKNYNHSAKEINLEIVNNLNDFMGGVLRDDDITVIVLKRV